MTREIEMQIQDEWGPENIKLAKRLTRNQV